MFQCVNKIKYSNLLVNLLNSWIKPKRQIFRWHLDTHLGFSNYNVLHKVTQLQLTGKLIEKPYCIIQRRILEPVKKEKWKWDDRNGSRTISSLLVCFLGFSFFQKEEREQEDDPMIVLLKFAKLYESRHDLDLAADYYHKALAVLQERELEKSWTEDKVLQGKIYIYDGMANVAFGMFHLKEAEKLYKETIKGLLQSGKQQNNNAIIEISLKLATIYSIEGRFSEANNGYQFCISLLEDKLKCVDVIADKTDDSEGENDHHNNLALLGMCSSSYARFLILQGKFADAEPVLTKCIGIGKQIFGENDNQIAVLYNDLATVASHKSNHDEAKMHANTAINIGKTVSSDDLSMFYCNLCFICLDRNEFAEARQAGKAARRLAKENGKKDIEEQSQNCLKEIAEKKQQR